MISVRKLIQVIESIPWVRCASGNVLFVCFMKFWSNSSNSSAVFQATLFLESSRLCCDHIDACCDIMDIPEWMLFKFPGWMLIKFPGWMLIKWSHWQIGISWQVTGDWSKLYIQSQFEPLSWIHFVASSWLLVYFRMPVDLFQTGD